MGQKTKNIIIIAAALIISLLAIFGFYKIAQAPSRQNIKNFLSLASNPQFKNSHNIIKADSPQNINNPRLPANDEPQPIVFIFGGDVMLSRQTNTKMVKYNDYSWPFAKIADFLKNADLTIINLESPFTKAKDYFVPTGSFIFKADPRAVVGLLDAGIDLISLANNHIYNQGRTGLTTTFKILKDNGIKFIGAGANENQAHQGEIINIRGQKFGFLAYAYPNDNSVATAKNSGIANMDIKKMKNDIQRLKTQDAIVIVIMHAGEEYNAVPNKQQITFAHQAIEAGAEAVIGHHPHWPQIWEFYQNKPIIYSLGNLIFDQMWSEETRRGLLVKMFWQNGWQKIELVPIKIFDYGQAEVLPDGPDKQSILKKINAPENGQIK